jgi:hypothetical protein
MNTPKRIRIMVAVRSIQYETLAKNPTMKVMREVDGLETLVVQPNTKLIKAIKALDKRIKRHEEKATNTNKLGGRASKDETQEIPFAPYHRQARGDFGQDYAERAGAT